MKMLKSRKGFTLIELLIVITIIGILAVAFLPTLLGAPAKGRDTQRIADLQKIQKILMNGDLEGTDYPVASVCIGKDTTFDGYKAAFGGALPSDPQAANEVDTCTTSNTSAGMYQYYVNPFGTGGAATGTYSFGLMAKTENKESANTTCTAGKIGGIATPTDADQCYAVFVE